MICPYSECGKEIQTAQNLTHCQSCAHPVVLCGTCQTPNHMFARRCRRCGQPQDSASFTYLPLEKRTRKRALSEFGPEARHIEIDDEFWVAPVLYREFLWCLSTSGAVYRLSLFDERAEYCGTFTAGFGETSFSIAEVPNDASMRDWTPYLISINKGSLSGLNLLTMETKQFLEVRREERILSNFENEFVTLVTDNRRAYFLKKQGTHTYLSSYDFPTKECKDYALGEEPVAGPFKLGDSIGVYFENDVGVLGGEGLKRYTLPRFFKSFTSPGGTGDLRLPVGRMPFMSNGNSIYIPGRQENLDSSTMNDREVAGFLFFSLKGPDPSYSFISAARGLSYSQNSAGYPLVVRNRKLSYYDGAGAIPLKDDEQFVPLGPAFYEDGLKICFARSGGGGVSLRFYQDQSPRPFDYPIADLPDYLVPGGFYQTVGHLAFVYRNRQSYLRFMVWDTYAG